MSEFIGYLEEHPGLFVALGGVATAITAAIGCAFQYFAMRNKHDRIQDELTKAKKREGELEQTCVNLKKGVKDAKRQSSKEKADLVDRLRKVKKRWNEWKEEHAALEEEKNRLDQELATASADLAEKSVSHEHLQAIERRLKEYRRSRLWARPVMADAPPFLPRDQRQTRIISVLNLKGGVGKTTITANLGAALAEDGKVLMIDLDFQRSLSRLMLSSPERNLRHYARRCVQHFLSGQTHDVGTFLELIGDPIDGPDGCWFMPNSDSIREASTANEPSNFEDDSLEETELRLMFEWIFEQNAKDIRFHLRAATHHPAPDNPFKYVLMDCPPRLTTACVNALAASDYVIVPVTLDAMAANSVPYLLKNLKHLKVALPSLEVLGVVANKVKLNAGNLTATQQDAWDNLRNQCPDILFFDTKIKDDAAIGMFANESIEEDKRTMRETKRYEGVRDAFTDLAKEVVAEMEKRDERAAIAVQA